MELTPSTLAEIIASDPALTALLLRISHKKGTTIREIKQLLDGLTLREIRDAVLSAGICGGLTEDTRADFRRELTRHCLAVACCAEKLAQNASPPLDGQTAYLAGLLHDIGKFLLDEAMPKSFDTLLEQARAGKTSFAAVEQENLGLDHTILGKRFAQKLQLPSDIILGIWLHHSHSGAISQAMPQARIATAVELADCIVRKAGIGESGNYETKILPENLAESLGLQQSQISEVEEQLPALVGQRSEAAGLSLLRPMWAYCDALRATTSQLAEESSKLFEASGRLESNAGHYDFIKELLPRIDSTLPAVEMAKDFAVAWQKFYQTGPVIIYLTGLSDAKTVEAVIVENPTNIKTGIFEMPDDAALIPQPISEKFAIIDASDYVDWLLEQTEVKFDLGRTKLAPLQSAGGFDILTTGGSTKLTTSKTAGVIVFEMRHPVLGDIEERFAPAAKTGGVLLNILQTIGEQQWFAERFIQALAAPAASPQKPSQESQPEALAEMAAGAAHELNNPLSVISGRAQLLAGTETDPDKKRILEQIQQNAGELSLIIDDLMSYANPEKPRPTETAVGQIIKDATDLTIQKKKTGHLDIKIDVSPDTPSVFVDSAQIASAISNIICNGLESYETLRQSPVQAETIEIKAGAASANGAVSIEVVDSGIGMDEQTLAKATQPFFSAKPAGRKRGMGLAHAKRLIEINHGTLEITSQPGKGTRVKVTMPCK
jgi:putative nucleotidyltransferase with HDIG domain